MAAPLILVVDDDRSIVDMIQMALSDEGYRVLAAHDGYTALGLINDQHPDLILMDVNMPIMGGEEAIAFLKDDPMTASIPIVACTASLRKPIDMPSVADVLCKPFTLDALYGAIQRGLLRAIA